MKGFTNPRYYLENITVTYTTYTIFFARDLWSLVRSRTLNTNNAFEMNMETLDKYLFILFSG